LLTVQLVERLRALEAAVDNDDDDDDDGVNSQAETEEEDEEEQEKEATATEESAHKTGRRQLPRAAAQSVSLLALRYFFFFIFFFFDSSIFFFAFLTFYSVVAPSFLSVATSFFIGRPCFSPPLSSPRPPLSPVECLFSSILFFV
jgi:hypothetical protein